MKQMTRSQFARREGYNAAQILTDDGARAILKMSPQERHRLIDQATPKVFEGTGEPIPIAQVLAWQEGYSKAIDERAAQLNRPQLPVFDGTRQSCRNGAEYEALKLAFDDIERAAEALLNEAVRVSNAMARVRLKLFHGLAGVEPNANSIMVKPRSVAHAVRHTGIDELGELRECDINRLCGVFRAKQQHALGVLHALRYRLPKEDR